MTQDFLQQKFQEADKDADGFITVQDLKKSLQEIAKELNLVLRIEMSHPNLSQRIDFSVFEGYLMEKLSQEATLYYHNRGTLGRQSTSVAMIDAIPEQYSPEDAPKDETTVELDQVLAILDGFDPHDPTVFSTFLQRHHPKKDSFSTVNIRI